MEKSFNDFVKKIDFKLVGIIAAVLALIILIPFLFGISTENRCISMEGQIEASASSIQVQLKKRTDVVRQLVQVVEQFSNHEKSIVASVTEARAQLNAGNATEALNTLNVVIENYPTIAAGDSYKHLMNEISICENSIANYRDNYNVQVREYKTYVRKFPARWFLSARGYSVIDYDYIDFGNEDLSVIEDMFQ